MDAEFSSSYNTDRWSECHEEISESAAHFTDFIHVPRFRDERSKFVGQVRNFFFCYMLSRLSSDKLDDQNQNRRSFPKSGINPTESSLYVCITGD
jgi:hypothetical protein